MKGRKMSSQVVVVTGASAGIGRAVVREFAKEGASIGLVARGLDGLEAAKREVDQLGGQAIVIPADVSRFEEVENAARQTEEVFGPIDIWVNNAMATVLGNLRDITPDEYRRVTDVSYHGYVWGTMVALKRMRERNRGTIVQVGSALGHRSIPLQAPYCGAKHAIIGFTESLRSELIHAGSKVRVTMVELPGVNTTQFNFGRNKMPRKSKPVGTIFQPEVAARAIGWAAHHRGKELLVGSPTVQAVVGQKMFPSLLDNYLARIVYRQHFSDEREREDRLDNLWAPVAGDHGAHGPYDQFARDHSAQVWASTHGRSIKTALFALGAIGAVAAINAWRTSSEATGNISARAKI